MAFNKDEMNAPKWMDGAFFEKVLRRSEADDSVTVAEFQTTPGSRPGDHFASIIFRAAVSFVSFGEKKEISLIVKTMPELEGLKKDVLKDGKLFETETIMYEAILPEMHKLLRQAGDDTKLGPRLLYSSQDPTWVMVLEDLSKQNYVMKDTQLNLQESKILYAKLGRWHAASLCLSEKIPEMKSLDYNLGVIMNEKVAEAWNNNINILAKMCLEWPGYEHFSERLVKLRNPLLKRLKEMYTDQDNIYNVLNHGDCHYKNFMYQILDGKTEDVMLLDFQISTWGSPAIDIIYSMYNSVSIETRDNHREELIKFYYNEFVNALKMFEFQGKIPSLIDLRIEITKCGHLETFLTTMFLPLLILTPEEMMPQLAEQSNEAIQVDFSDVKEQEKLAEHCFKHPRYTAVMKKCLPVFDNMGLLDL
ncbi:conserved hypothetical protein [Culex quinquefasciatus]|uniref:CHK kinase-like domain-containing protein n=1 Tax=Culex quinquefasciatus TaxID=7176 RepID=B0WUM1_CULQU|nr:conserved hypothetical protein [Culex quinquefasciatus]|eukprot:XP_001858986.1 conserved hypothetical protein [Culex quinquefasciatus]